MVTVFLGKLLQYITLIVGSEELYETLFVSLASQYWGEQHCYHIRYRPFSYRNHA
jgi:hypothetical protein